MNFQSALHICRALFLGANAAVKSALCVGMMMEVNKQPVGKKADKEPESRFQYSLEFRCHDNPIIALIRPCRP